MLPDEGKTKEQLINELKASEAERKRVEEALQESEQRYCTLFEKTANPIFVIDAEGNYIVSNEAALQFIECTRDELLRKSIRDFIPPGKEKEVLDEHEALWISGGTIETEYYVHGEIRVLELTITPATWWGKRVIFGVGRDITERKRLEEREKRLQEELYLSSRLASIGELAAGVVHELNNPLTGIVGFSQLLLRRSTDQTVSRDLERIHNEAQRAVKVVQNLLAFARRREAKKQYSDINEILGRALELRAYELRTSNIELVVELAPGLPKIMADFGQIQEVFLNIILNAEQAVTEANRGGKLSVKTRKIRDYIEVCFTDNGPGIAAKHRGKVFDPFFTTRGEKGGTGLGLSVCHGIVREHGGRIYVKSKPGKGATFIVELPVITEEIDESKVAD